MPKKHHCAVCGKELGFNRYSIPQSGCDVCSDCFRKAGGKRAGLETIEDIREHLGLNADGTPKSEPQAAPAPAPTAAPATAAAPQQAAPEPAEAPKAPPVQGGSGMPALHPKDRNVHAVMVSTECPTGSEGDALYTRRLNEILTAMQDQGYEIAGVTFSPIPGGAKTLILYK